MNRYKFTVYEARITTYEVYGENESAARQAFMDDDCTEREELQLLASEGAQDREDWRGIAMNGDGKGNPLHKAYVDGYRAGRRDRIKGYRSVVSYYAGMDANAHERAYSAGYRDGHDGKPSNEAEYERP